MGYRFCDMQTCMCAGQKWVFPAVFPIEFRDSRMRVVRVSYFDDAQMAELVEMYETYNPRGKANGLPPVDDDTLCEWLYGVMNMGISLVAMVDGRIAGHSILFPLPPECSRAEFGIFVHQDYQGYRIGTNLTCVTVSFAKLIGFKSVWLIVEPNNRRAVSMYKHIGFGIEGNIDSEMYMTYDVDSQQSTQH